MCVCVHMCVVGGSIDSTMPHPHLCVLPIHTYTFILHTRVYIHSDVHPPSISVSATSFWSILPAIKEVGHWEVLQPDATSPLSHDFRHFLRTWIDPCM